MEVQISEWRKYEIVVSVKKIRQILVEDIGQRFMYFVSRTDIL